MGWGRGGGGVRVTAGPRMPPEFLTPPFHCCARARHNEETPSRESPSINNAAFKTVFFFSGIVRSRCGWSGHKTGLIYNEGLRVVIAAKVVR